MMKLIAILLLFNNQMYQTQSCVTQQTSDSVTTDIANDPASTSSSGSSTMAPGVTTTTEASAELSLETHKGIWNTFDLGVLSNLGAVSTTSSPLKDYQPAATDNDDVLDQLPKKITFAGRRHLGVVRNCGCSLHGRCIRRYGKCNSYKKDGRKVEKSSR